MPRKSGRGTARVGSKGSKKRLPPCRYGQDCWDGSKKHGQSFFHPVIEEEEEEEEEYGTAAADEYVPDYDSDEMSQQTRFGVQDYDEKWEETGWLVSIKNVLENNIQGSAWTDEQSFELEAQTLALEVVDEYLNKIERGSKHWISFEDFMIDFNKELNQKIKSKKYRDKKYYDRLKLIAGALTAGISVYYLYGTYAVDVGAGYFTCAMSSVTEALGLSSGCAPKDIIGWALWKFKNNMNNLFLTTTGVAIVTDRAKNLRNYLRDTKNYVKSTIDYLLDRGEPMDYQDIINSVADEVLPEPEEEEEEDTRIECMFGDACYRTGRAHRETYKHPPDGRGAKRKTKKKKCKTKKCKKMKKLRETMRRKLEKRKKGKGKTKKKK